jgi:hypothetical protein
MWTKSTGLWTEGDRADPWSMVDRSPYHFARPSIFYSMAKSERVGSAVAEGGAIGARGSRVASEASNGPSAVGG